MGILLDDLPLILVFYFPHTISVAHATVTQKVSHLPVKPKYGSLGMKNIVVTRSPRL